MFDSIDDAQAQAQVDGWVRHYNLERRQQGNGDVVPWDRFRLAGEDLIRRHKIRHDRSRENGAFANPGGRPHRINAA